MKLSRKELINAIHKTMKFAAKRSSLPILETIRVVPQTNFILLSATNTDHYISVMVPLDVAEHDDPFIIEDPKALLKFLKQLKDDDLEINAKDFGGYTKVKYTCGKREFTSYTAMRPCDFAETPNAVENNIGYYQYNAPALKKRMKAISYAASTTDYKPIMTGIHFHENNMVALDGRRLALAKTEIDFGKNNFTVPAVSLNLACDVLDGDIQIYVNNKWITLNSKDTMVTIRLLAGKYFDYQAAMKLYDPRSVPVDVTAMVEDLKYLTSISPNKVDCNPIIWDGSTMTLTEGNQAVKVTTACELQCGRMGFNPHYLLEGFEHFPDPEATILYQNPRSPIHVTSADFTTLIFPIRLK